jgi:cyanophycinase
VTGWVSGRPADAANSPSAREIPVGQTPGIVMPIGGAEDKVGRMSILRDVARLAGGAQARLVVLSTASSLGDEITRAYLALFGALGIRDVRGIRPESRAQAADPSVVGAIGDATAVFMTGGNQTKLAALVVGTPLGEAIVAAHRRGALIAGTSAGASVCSEHMVSFGSEGATPKFRIGQVSQGLGLLTGAIVDQHFTQRNRFGRLLALIGANPAQLGIGIDEDTAAIVAPDGTFEVRGRGVVTVIDGADLITTAYTATGTQPLMLSNLKLHTLPRGAVFDLHRRVLVSAPGLADTDGPQTVTTLADVPPGTRPRSRQIAAEGAHSTTHELRRRPASE